MKIINEDMLDEYIEKIEQRRDDDDLEITTEVKKILFNVKKGGDQSLIEYTRKFDDVELKDVEVSKEEIALALTRIEKKLYDALVTAKENIEQYHKIQVTKSKFIEKEDIRIGEIVSPLNRVGVYVPGGKATYPSTVLMNVIPAKLAGVKDIVIVTPAMKCGGIKDSVLVAASICGVNKIYKLGGAQSIAALAYGTETIKKVNKIVGPGNIYVATAKKIVSSRVGIDMIAGPSEVAIICDKSSKAEYIAADLIAQAEHDERAASICISTSDKVLSEVVEQLKIQVKDSPRRKIIEEALSNYGGLIKVKNIDKAIEIANLIAPEHLEIMTEEAEEVSKKINSAGAIFIGDYSPEALGDYIAGPNHTLPTSGTAAFSSPLGVTDFTKKTSYISYNKKSLQDTKEEIITIANDEGLYGHANSIKIRFKEK